MCVCVCVCVCGGGGGGSPKILDLGPLHDGSSQWNITIYHRTEIQKQLQLCCVSFFLREQWGHLKFICLTSEKILSKYTECASISFQVH